MAPPTTDAEGALAARVEGQTWRHRTDGREDRVRLRVGKRKDRGREALPWSMTIGAPGIPRPRGDDAIAGPEKGETHMRRKQVQGVLMGLGLAALLTVGGGTWGVASAAPQAQAQSFTGQVREIKIDECGLEPGTCAGSLVLAQARGQQVDLTIPAGTTIQRGDQRVHLEELGVGNYVMVQAVPLSPFQQGNGRNWTWDEIDAYEHSPINSATQGD